MPLYRELLRNDQKTPKICNTLIPYPLKMCVCVEPHTPSCSHYADGGRIVSSVDSIYVLVSDSPLTSMSICNIVGYLSTHSFAPNTMVPEYTWSLTNSLNSSGRIYTELFEYTSNCVPCQRQVLSYAVHAYINYGHAIVCAITNHLSNKNVCIRRASRLHESHFAFYSASFTDLLPSEQPITTQMQRHVSIEWK